jgi:hypothetical protein
VTRSRPDGPPPSAGSGGASTIDLVPNDLALARAQMSSGLATLAEGTASRLIARLAVAGRGSQDQLDAARALLAEALWRQGRPLAAGAAVQQIRASSLERKRPIVKVIEAEALAAAGDADGATAIAEKVVGALGVDEAWRLRGGVASRVAWPLPPSLRAPARRSSRPAGMPLPATFEPTAERAAAARSRIDHAREAYEGTDLVEGDRQLAAALRLDPRLGGEGIGMLEATLGEEPDSDRLLLYGDLLRAAGREAEAEAALDRAASA